MKQIPDRCVKRTDIGDVTISTVFTGDNHNFGRGAPLLFETMVSGGPLCGQAEHYSTWEQAEEGHNRWIDKVEYAQDSFTVARLKSLL